MKPFNFQRFSIQQSSDVFRVGTDAVLLGAMANAVRAETILEVGAGTGIISLMLAQRNPLAKISAIDIDENAAALCRNNFQNSEFSERLSVIKADFNDFETESKFDLIVCNPPYFEENPSEKDKKARQKISLDFQGLVSNAAKLLSENGLFSVIIPSQFADDFIEAAGGRNLFLSMKINIFGIEGREIKRNILEFSLSKNPISETDFTIEKSSRIYSNQYLELTKEFHIFGK